MIRLAPLLLLALAACAAPQAAETAAPPPAAPPAPAISVSEREGAIRVAGRAAHEDALAAHHCAAAERAAAKGAAGMEWLGGVATRDRTGEGVTADLVYQETAAAPAATGARPGERGAAALADWLLWCEGEA